MEELELWPHLLPFKSHRDSAPGTVPGVEALRFASALERSRSWGMGMNIMLQ